MNNMNVMIENIILSWGLLLGSLVVCSNAHPGGPPLQSGAQKWWHGWDDNVPSLATEQINMTAILGHSVSLPCRVTNLGDRTVSWIRSRDLSVLAVDRVTVTTDARISVVHHMESEDWPLEIRGIAQADEGSYECQVNTHPKKSTKIHLKVIPDRGQVSILDIPVSDTGVISDSKDLSRDDGSHLRVRVIGRRFVQAEVGSTLRLVCEAAGKELKDMQYYSPPRNDQLISWTLDGIAVLTLWDYPKVMVRESRGGTTIESEVEVKDLGKGDGGTFACNVPQVQPDLVTVTVIDDRDSNGHHHAQVVSLESEDSSDVMKVDDSDFSVAGAAGNAAIISGAILLFLLLVQAGMCIFYIKKC